MNFPIPFTDRLTNICSHCTVNRITSSYGQISIRKSDVCTLITRIPCRISNLVVTAVRSTVPEMVGIALELTSIFSRGGGVSGGEGVGCRSVRGIYERVAGCTSEIGGIGRFIGTGSVDVGYTGVSVLVVSAVASPWTGVARESGRGSVGGARRFVVAALESGLSGLILVLSDGTSLFVSSGSSYIVSGFGCYAGIGSVPVVSCLTLEFTESWSSVV